MRRVHLAAAAALLVATASHAAAQSPPPVLQSPETLAKVYACSDVADSAARLACFDAAVAAMKAAQTQGQFAAVDAVGVRQIEREAFGFSLPSLPRLGLPGIRRDGSGAPAEPERTPEIAMTIARIGHYDGRTSFVMDNGQVWVLIDSKDNRFARAGAAVTIRRALAGSYLMGVDQGGPALRVRRAE